MRLVRATSPPPTRSTTQRRSSFNITSQHRLPLYDSVARVAGVANCLSHVGTASIGTRYLIPRKHFHETGAVGITLV